MTGQQQVCAYPPAIVCWSVTDRRPIADWSPTIGNHRWLSPTVLRQILADHSNWSPTGRTSHWPKWMLLQHFWGSHGRRWSLVVGDDFGDRWSPTGRSQSVTGPLYWLYCSPLKQLALRLGNWFFVYKKIDPSVSSNSICVHSLCLFSIQIYYIRCFCLGLLCGYWRLHWHIHNSIQQICHGLKWF